MCGSHCGAAAFVVALLLILLLLVVGSWKHGHWWQTAIAFLVGLLPRAIDAGGPFRYDRDIQRVFTAHGSPLDILRVSFFYERHPPLFFLIHHCFQWFGQSPAWLRTPTILLGALIAPLILWSTRTVRGSVGPLAVVAALCAALSPAFIGVSRQVSDMTLFSCAAIAAATALAQRMQGQPSTGRRVAITHGLMLWSYYDALMFLFGELLVVLAWRDSRRPLLRNLGAGILLGAPWSAFPPVVALRDYRMREIAHSFRSLAWGENSTGGFAKGAVLLAWDSLGWLLPVIVCVALVASVRRMFVVLLPIAGVAVTAAVTIVGCVLARVSVEYLLAILPVTLLALAWFPLEVAPPWRRIIYSGAALALAFGLATRTDEALALYAPSPDVYWPQFAAVATARPETTIVVLPEYEAHMAAYHLAAEQHLVEDWSLESHSGAGMMQVGKKKVAFLADHNLPDNPDREALRLLAAMNAREPLLIVDTDRFHLPSVDAALANECSRLSTAPTARLWGCPAGGIH